MTKDAPAFDFYPERWLAGTAHMSDAEQLAYFRLLCHSWIMDGLPDDQKALKRLAGRGISQAVMQKFARDADGKLRNKRMEIVREEQRARIAKSLEKIGKMNAARLSCRPYTRDSTRESETPHKNDSKNLLEGSSPLTTHHPSSKEDITASVPSAEVPEVKDQRFTEIKTLWAEAYKKKHGDPYTFSKGQDFRELQTFLKNSPDLAPDKFIKVTEAAWEAAQDPFTSIVKKSGTITDICRNYDAIRAELNAIRNQKPKTNGTPKEPRYLGNLNTPGRYASKPKPAGAEPPMELPNLPPRTESHA